MHPRIFGLLTFPIFLTLAVAVGTAVHLRLAKRAGLPVLGIVALYVAMGVAMLVGARVFSVLLEADPSASRWIGSKLRYPGVPLRFDGVRPAVRQPPRLDQHRAEILAELEGRPAAEQEQKS